MSNLAIILISSFSTASIIAVIAFIFRSWFKASIKHEYDLKKLEIENKKEIRVKSEIVAELLAEWIRRGEKLDYHKLNRLSFQAYLWLPKNLAEDLSASLSHEKESKDVRALLKEIRCHLHNKDDGLDANQVIIFDEPELHLHHMPLYSSSNDKPEKHWPKK